MLRRDAALPRGFTGARYRTSTVFVVVEGNGRTVVGSEALAWREHDVFVMPSWCEYHHEAADESLLFSFSDRPVQEKLYGASVAAAADAAPSASSSPCG